MNEKLRKHFKSLLNIPNVLTIIRLVCVPILLVMFFVFRPNYLPSLCVFVIASLTDLLDGFLARKFNQITPVGIVLDPLADKLLKSATLFCLAFEGIIFWWFFGIIVAVDLTMILMGIFLFGKNITIPSNIIGKTGTLVITIGIFLSFFPSVFAPWYEYILYAGFGVVFSSVVLYVSLNYKKVINALKKKKEDKSFSDKNNEETQKNK
ncbi:MAG: CDP-alcohol phosphatidyltransferase family protein [Clostridia bacterium]|nr:CDP-alcohol phosphatidyltransferase family protein [Clostridia bacterium]